MPILVILLIIIIAIVNISIVRKKEIEEARKKTTEYLCEKYNTDFDLEFSSVGYKSNEHGLIITQIECGHDKNIKEWVFKVHSPDGAYHSYVTV